MLQQILNEFFRSLVLQPRTGPTIPITSPKLYRELVANQGVALYRDGVRITSRGSPAPEYWTILVNRAGEVHPRLSISPIDEGVPDLGGIVTPERWTATIVNVAEPSIFASMVQSHGFLIRRPGDLYPPPPPPTDTERNHRLTMRRVSMIYTPLKGQPQSKKQRAEARILTAEKKRRLRRELFLAKLLARKHLHLTHKPDRFVSVKNIEKVGHMYIAQTTKGFVVRVPKEIRPGDQIADNGFHHIWGD